MLKEDVRKAISMAYKFEDEWQEYLEYVDTWRVLMSGCAEEHFGESPIDFDSWQQMCPQDRDKCFDVPLSQCNYKEFLCKDFFGEND